METLTLSHTCEQCGQSKEVSGLLYFRKTAPDGQKTITDPKLVCPLCLFTFEEHAKYAQDRCTVTLSFNRFVMFRKEQVLRMTSKRGFDFNALALPHTKRKLIKFWSLLQERTKACA